MNIELLKLIILSKKTMTEIISALNCTVDEFVLKISGNMEFDNIDISILTDILSIDNPVYIFFNNNVAE